MITIEKAGLADLSLINKLAHTIWPETYKAILSPEQMEYMLDKMYSPSVLQDQLEKLQHKFILVFETDKPVGFASYSPKENHKNIYRLHKIYISTDRQGKGIGKKIIDYIIDDIKDKAQILELNVNRKNIAKNFYEKIGFIITSEEDIPIGNGYFMNDYVMQKNI